MLWNDKRTPSNVHTEHSTGQNTAGGWGASPPTSSSHLSAQMGAKYTAPARSAAAEPSEGWSKRQGRDSDQYHAHYNDGVQRHEAARGQASAVSPDHPGSWGPKPQLAGMDPHAGPVTHANNQERFNTYARAQNFSGDIKARQDFKAKSPLKRAALTMTGRKPKVRTPGLKLK